MQINKRKLVMVIAFTIIGPSAARGQAAIDRLQSLAETSAQIAHRTTSSTSEMGQWSGG